MENIIINPENYQADYIRYINECFNHWGQDREYDWAFNRKVGDKASDIMIIKNEEDEVIAGSAVTYRKVKSGEGSPVDIAIMTGSWTLPKARGRGCFTKIIDISRELAAKKGVPYLTAFVTESNASFRRLRDAGSALMPTTLLFSPEEPYADADTSAISVVSNEKEVLPDIYSRFKASEKEALHYDYTHEEFYQQYISRPKDSEILKLGNEYAILEETHNVVKVLLITYDSIDSYERIIKQLSNWSLANRAKKLYLFSTKEEVVNKCESLGFEKMPGYFTIMSTNSSADPEKLMQLNIHMGDKM